MRIILSFLFAAGLFLMPPAQAASLTVCNPAGQSEDGVYVDTILASSSGTAVDFPRADTETIEAAGDGLEAFNALFLARGWGDVPPTPERVKAMLAGYDLPDDFPIATLPPLDGVATVGKIAVNAVMAGCEPRHMPLLVAAVEAVSQPEFDLRGVATTTNPDSVLVIVSGPIVKRLGINAGTNTFGRGNRANACIGRALHLIISNVGGSRTGITDMSTLGQPGDFAMFLAENADASPWPSFHTEYGFLPEGIYDRDTFALRLMEKPASFFYSVLWNKLYRRDILADHHLQFTSEVRWAEDLVFNLEYILYANVFVSISKAGYHYVQNPQSICHTQINLASIVQNKLQVFRYYKELYTKLGLYDQVQPQLYKFLTAFSENAYPSGSPQKIIMDMANHWGFGVLDASDKEKKHKTEPDA